MLEAEGFEVVGEAGDGEPRSRPCASCPGCSVARRAASGHGRLRRRRAAHRRATARTSCSPRAGTAPTSGRWSSAAARAASFPRASCRRAPWPRSSDEAAAQGAGRARRCSASLIGAGGRGGRSSAATTSTDAASSPAVGLFVGSSFIGTGLFAWWRRPAEPDRRADGRRRVRLDHSGADGAEHARRSSCRAAVRATSGSCCSPTRCWPIPSGRLETARAAVMAAALDVGLLLQIPVSLFFKTPDERLAARTAPTNPLLITRQPRPAADPVRDPGRCSASRRSRAGRRARAPLARGTPARRRSWHRAVARAWRRWPVILSSSRS